MATSLAVGIGEDVKRMAGVQRFEDLIAWQEARSLAKKVLLAASQEPLARHVRLAGQLEGAAVSVMSNIAEGFEQDNWADFSRFLTVAKASCGEVRSPLYVLEDADLVDIAVLERLRSLTAETNRVVFGLRSSLEGRKWTNLSGRSIDEDDPDSYVLWPNHFITEH